MINICGSISDDLNESGAFVKFNSCKLLREIFKLVYNLLTKKWIVFDRNKTNTNSTFWRVNHAVFRRLPFGDFSIILLQIIEKIDENCTEFHLLLSCTNRNARHGHGRSQRVEISSLVDVSLGKTRLDFYNFERRVT
jgi:hypothetical protein